MPSWEAQEGDGSTGWGRPESPLQGEHPPPGRRSGKPRQFRTKEASGAQHTSSSISETTEELASTKNIAHATKRKKEKHNTWKGKK